MPKLLSNETARRVRELVYRTKGADVLAHNRGGVRSWTPVIVRCLSAEAAGDSGAGAQCYSAEVVTINSLVDEQATGALVWLTVLNGVDSVVAPVVDQIYAGLYAGQLDIDSDIRDRVFAASPEESPGSPGDLQGGGECVFTKVKSTDCLTLSDTMGDVILRGGGPWVGTNARGDWEFGYDAAVGIVYLELGGIRLMNCFNGCFTGSEFTGHLELDEDDPSCDATVFTVCLECRCCPFTDWDGVANKWYCMEIDAVCTPVLIVGDGDECDDWVYCSGPYDTEEDAAAVCPGGGGSFFPCSDDFNPFGDPGYTDPVQLSAPDPGCSKTLLWSGDGIWTALGCAGTSVTLYCDAGVWKLSTSATDPACVGGTPQVFAGSSGSLLSGTLTFMVQRCLMQASGGDSTMVAVTFSY